MNVSLAMLKQQLYAMRAWDSTGETQDNRIRQALNVALDRMASDVPQALVPDEEHVVLYPDVVSSTSTVDARVITLDNDKRLLEFVDSTGTAIADPTSLTSWRPTVTGEWDGIMHIEITDSDGRIHRRQCLEWFKTPVGNPTVDVYSVTLDRPYNEIITTDNDGVGALHFRIHQPEFFVDDNVIEIMEPARIFDGSRQQVWKIDTAGASRQDMLDFEGASRGRPYRCWRGRHFQLPAPTRAPNIVEPNIVRSYQGFDQDTISSEANGTETAGSGNLASSGVLNVAYTWPETLALRRGKWAVCYTYVLGRKDEDWQQSPLVTPGADIEQDSSYGLTWSYNKDASPLSGENLYSGIHDPQFESAPSPVTIISQTPGTGVGPALVLSATNIDAMLGFGDVAYKRYGRTGLRIRYYVAHLEANIRDVGKLNDVETNQRFHLLCEVEPTFDMVTVLADAGISVPTAITALSSASSTAARIVWNGTQLYDYHRTLKHSTGYYAWKVFPHQDARYELDFRVSRMPRKYINDQDTAPIHPEAVPTLIELALYYVSLVDGNDQISAQAHLNRYQDLVRVFRDRYGNPGGIVEPVPILGYSQRHRYGTFGSSE